MFIYESLLEFSLCLSEMDIWKSARLWRVDIELVFDSAKEATGLFPGVRRGGVDQGIVL